MESDYVFKHGLFFFKTEKLLDRSPMVSRQWSFFSFERGDLKMAALRDDAVLHFDVQNNVQIQFIDEDDFPLASFTEHRASDEEFYSGASESSSEDSGEESEEEDHTGNEVELNEEDWSREVER
ncbi:hypothetical protein AWC38_SpisGene15828 [Stylophora pistillata]|uniref:Uncharacterized protein n=1 Tax=Stylophora pistillata TaxID=50429 RepID=A0A2B4RSF6_STYPI|nr:hypothetical protein AWC38_SpisGene15828 [Stylophora pistillata]